MMDNSTLNNNPIPQGDGQPIPLGDGQATKSQAPQYQIYDFGPLKTTPYDQLSEPQKLVADVIRDNGSISESGAAAITTNWHKNKPTEQQEFENRANQIGTTDALRAEIAEIDKGIVEFGRIKEVIDQFENHDGFSEAVGFSWMIGRISSGNSYYGAKALYERLEGMNFMDAYKMLKGGGQITQIEGDKATAARAALQLDQPEKDWKTNSATFVKEINEDLLVAKRLRDQKIANLRELLGKDADLPVEDQGAASTDKVPPGAILLNNQDQYSKGDRVTDSSTSRDYQILEINGKKYANPVGVPTPKR